MVGWSWKLRRIVARLQHDYKPIPVKSTVEDDRETQIQNNCCVAVTAFFAKGVVAVTLMVSIVAAVLSITYSGAELARGLRAGWSKTDGVHNDDVSNNSRTESFVYVVLTMVAPELYMFFLAGVLSVVRECMKKPVKQPKRMWTRDDGEMPNPLDIVPGAGLGSSSTMGSSDGGSGQFPPPLNRRATSDSDMHLSDSDAESKSSASSDGKGSDDEAGGGETKSKLRWVLAMGVFTVEAFLESLGMCIIFMWVLPHLANIEVIALVHGGALSPLVVQICSLAFAFAVERQRLRAHKDMTSLGYTPGPASSIEQHRNPGQYQLSASQKSKALRKSMNSKLVIMAILFVVAICNICGLLAMMVQTVFEKRWYFSLQLWEVLFGVLCVSIPHWHNFVSSESSVIGEYDLLTPLLNKDEAGITGCFARAQHNIQVLGATMAEFRYSLAHFKALLKVILIPLIAFGLAAWKSIVSWSDITHLHMSATSREAVLFYVFVGSTTLLNWLGQLAIGLRLQKACFAFPLYASGPIMVLVDVCHPAGGANFHSAAYWTAMALAFIPLWLSQVIAARHAWRSNYMVLPMGQTIFNRPCGANMFASSTLLFNRNFREDPKKSTSLHKDVFTFVALTMWHEEKEEMKAVLKSLSKLKPVRALGQPRVDYEIHVVFDDAFKNGSTRAPNGNAYVHQFIKQLNKAFGGGIIHKRTFCKSYGRMMRMSLPNGIEMFVHLKDVEMTKQKKRWSQILYLCFMYHRLRELVRIDPTLADKAVYVLTLDGDVSFEPHSVEQMVDFIQRDDRVKSVCGRIHPLGSGPIAWYQIFEYAVGHWMQKVAEHVIGSVLCSPGCYSIFDFDTLWECAPYYAVACTKPSHILMYDQGEDRYLSTLIVSRGFALQYCATADAKTYCPDDFAGFFNQRRRWVTSTLINIYEMLKRSGSIVRHNPSVPLIFIPYVIMVLLSTIISPASITLLIIGGLKDVVGLHIVLTYIIGCAPVVVFVLAIMFCKGSTQINVAFFLNIIYGTLMAVVLVSVAVGMAADILSPTSIFSMCLFAFYFLAAFLHPYECWMIIFLPLYIICIPSAYLVLTMFSLGNMHVTSWGTRDGSGGHEAAKDVSGVIGKVTSWLKRIVHGQAKPPPTEDLESSGSSGGSTVGDNDANRESASRAYVPPEVSYAPPTYTIPSHNQFPAEAASPGPSRSASVSSGNPGVDPLYTDFLLQLATPSSHIMEDYRETAMWRSHSKWLKPPVKTEKNQEKQKDLMDGLKKMRRDTNAWLLIVNMFWVAVVGALYYQKSLTVWNSNVAGLGFLMVFGITMLVQVVAMLVHRLWSLLHLIGRINMRNRPARGFIEGWCSDDDDDIISQYTEKVALKKAQARMQRESRKRPVDYAAIKAQLLSKSDPEFAHEFLATLPENVPGHSRTDSQSLSVASCGGSFGERSINDMMGTSIPKSSSLPRTGSFNRTNSQGDLISFNDPPETSGGRNANSPGITRSVSWSRTPERSRPPLAHMSSPHSLGSLRNDAHSVIREGVEASEDHQGAQEEARPTSTMHDPTATAGIEGRVNSPLPSVDELPQVPLLRPGMITEEKGAPMNRPVSTPIGKNVASMLQLQIRAQEEEIERQKRQVEEQRMEAARREQEVTLQELRLEQERLAAERRELREKEQRIQREKLKLKEEEAKLPKYRVVRPDETPGRLPSPPPAPTTSALPSPAVADNFVKEKEVVAEEENIDALIARREILRERARLQAEEEKKKEQKEWEEARRRSTEIRQLEEAKKAREDAAAKKKEAEEKAAVAEAERVALLRQLKIEEEKRKELERKQQEESQRMQEVLNKERLQQHLHMLAMQEELEKRKKAEKEQADLAAKKNEEEQKAKAEEAKRAEEAIRLRAMKEKERYESLARGQSVRAAMTTQSGKKPAAKSTSLSSMFQMNRKKKSKQ